MQCLHRLLVVPIFNGKEDLSQCRSATVNDLCNALESLATGLSAGTEGTRIIRLSKDVRQCLVTMLKLQNASDELLDASN